MICLDLASPLREMKLLEIDDSDLESHHSSEEDSPNLNYHETEIPTNNPSLLERKEEIIRAYQRATHIKDSLLDLLGSSSRY